MRRVLCCHGFRALSGGGVRQNNYAGSTSAHSSRPVRYSTLGTLRTGTGTGTGNFDRQTSIQYSFTCDEQTGGTYNKE
jgi:hypothetical protein